jgi:hypothetical protein
MRRIVPQFYFVHRNEEIRAHGSTCPGLRSHKPEVNLKPRNAYEVKYADGFTLTQRVRYWGRKARRRQGASVKGDSAEAGSPHCTLESVKAPLRVTHGPGGSCATGSPGPWPAGEGRLGGEGRGRKPRAGWAFSSAESWGYGAFGAFQCTMATQAPSPKSAAASSSRGLRFRLPRPFGRLPRPFGPRQEAQNRA